MGNYTFLPFLRFAGKQYFAILHYNNVSLYLRVFYFFVVCFNSIEKNIKIKYEKIYSINNFRYVFQLL